MCIHCIGTRTAYMQWYYTEMRFTHDKGGVARDLDFIWYRGFTNEIEGFVHKIEGFYILQALFFSSTLVTPNLTHLVSFITKQFLGNLIFCHVKCDGCESLQQFAYSFLVCTAHDG